MTPEAKLAAVLAADAPPTGDRLFQVAVALKIALRRAWLSAAAVLPWAILSTAVLWLLRTPLAEGSVALEGVLAPAGVAIAMGASAFVVVRELGRRVNAA